MNKRNTRAGASRRDREDDEENELPVSVHKKKVDHPPAQTQEGKMHHQCQDELQSSSAVQVPCIIVEEVEDHPVLQQHQPQLQQAMGFANLEPQQQGSPVFNYHNRGENITCSPTLNFITGSTTPPPPGGLSPRLQRAELPVMLQDEAAGGEQDKKSKQGVGVGTTSPQASTYTVVMLKAAGGVSPQYIAELTDEIIRSSSTTDDSNCQIISISVIPAKFKTQDISFFIKCKKRETAEKIVDTFDDEIFQASEIVARITKKGVPDNTMQVYP